MWGLCSSRWFRIEGLGFREVILLCCTSPKVYLNNSPEDCAILNTEIRWILTLVPNSVHKQTRRAA